MARGNGWGEFRPYVRVADKLARGERELARRVKKRGRPADPARTAGRKMVATFWGQAWCDNLARYSDFASRLPRGRAYAGNGSVLDLHVAGGRVEALVAGSELYEVRIDIAPLAARRWKKVIAGCSSGIGSLVELLRGELSTSVLAVLTCPERGLFPAPDEIELECSCPDWAEMCKHVAAALYCVGARLDQRPELFFTLRQVDQAELIAGAGAGAARRASAAGRRPRSGRVVRGDLGAVFGIDLDEAPAPPRRPGKRQPKRRAAPRV